MEKFSYALEFYNRGLFSLDDISLFKEKVKEAENIEMSLGEKIPNIDALRKYILRSYKFNKKLKGKERLHYIKGLIYADNIIDFDDIIEFSNTLENGLFNLPKTSLWRNKGFTVDSANPDFLEGEFEESDMKVVSNLDYYSYSEDFYMLGNGDLGDEEDSETDEFQILQAILENEDFEEYNEEFIPISPEEKIKQFKDNIDNIVNEVIKRKNIPKKERKYVKLGLRNWLDFTLNEIELLYNMKIKSLKLNNDNISDFI